MYGLSVSNFNGINGVHFNPTASVNSKVYLDVNLLTAGLSAENNFVFYHNQDFRFVNLLKRSPLLPSAEVRGEGLDYTTQHDNVSGFYQSQIIGPSFSMHVGRQAFGIFTKGLINTDFNNVPNNLAVLFFEGISYEPLYGVDIKGENVNAAALAWTEVGLNWSYVFKKDYLNNWSFGINLKRLSGNSGAYVVANDLHLNIVNKDTVDFINLSADVGYSLPLDYNTNEFTGTDPLFRGKGTAIDLGFSFVRNLDVSANQRYNRQCEASFQPYRYKIGASVSNLGRIAFDQNTKEHSYYNVSQLWQSIDTMEYSNVNDLMAQFSTVFYGDPQASLKDSNDMKIHLPAKINLHADYQYFPNWYLSGAFIFPLKLGNFQVRNPANAIVGVRYETDNVEFNFSGSFYDFQKLHLGFYARYKFLSVGTDKFGILLGASDVYGADIYVSLKFHLRKGYCYSDKPFRDCGRFQF